MRYLRLAQLYYWHDRCNCGINILRAASLVGCNTAIISFVAWRQYS